MNILINCLSSVSGGAVSYLSNLVPLLCMQFDVSSKNHSLKILSHESQRDLFLSVQDSRFVTIGDVRPMGWRRILWERRNMVRIARMIKCDVIFTPYQIGPRVEGLKQVLMIRNMEPFYFDAYRYGPKAWMRNRVLRWQSSRALRGADRVIAVSGFAESWLLEGLAIPPERIRKVHHGRDRAFSPAGESIADRDLLRDLGVEGDFIMSCGSFLPYRRYEDVIAAFDLCAGSLDCSIKLVIAGSGNDNRYTESVRRTIENSPYSDRILAVGQVSKEAMSSLYRRCLACIIATEIEACPNIAIEAMSSGCAIISSDRPPLPEMFDGSSLVFARRNIEELGRQILACVNDENLRRELGIRAQRRASMFSWEHCAKETYAALVDWPKG